MTGGTKISVSDYLWKPEDDAPQEIVFPKFKVFTSEQWTRLMEEVGIYESL